MQKDFSIDDVLRFSFSWTEDLESTAKLLALKFGVWALTIMLVGVSLWLFLSALGIPLAEIIANPDNAENIIRTAVGKLMLSPSSIINASIILMISLIVIAIISIVLNTYIDLKIYNFSFEKSNLPKIETNLFLAVKYFIFKIVKSFFVSLYSYNKTALILLYVFLLSAFIPLFFGILALSSARDVAISYFLLALIPGSGYLVVVAYNLFALIISDIYFLQDVKHAFFDSFKKSFEATKGNVLMIAIAIIILTLIMFIASFVVGIFIAFPLEILSRTFMLKGAFGLGIFLYFIENVISQLVEWISIIVGIFATTSIFVQLTQNSHKETEHTQVGHTL